MNKKILWCWLLLLQINFLVVWFRGDTGDYSIYSLLIGIALSYGMAFLLIYKIHNEQKNRKIKISREVLIFLAGGFLGGLLSFSMIIPLLQTSLFIILITLLFTSIYVFKKAGPVTEEDTGSE